MSWRESFLFASIACGILITAITEILSLFSLITFGWLLGCWVAVWLISACICFYLVNKIKFKFFLPPAVPKLEYFEILLLCSAAFIVLCVGLIAFVAPPNTWDSMAYHMSRVAHWIQNHNVSHYPTHIERQLTRNPFAEFSIMHLQVLSKGDRFAGFVQWLSMIGSLIGVSLIAKCLGANRRGQICAAVIAATIPMGILQASSTQNDYVVSFWLVCFVYFIIMLLRSGENKLYLPAAAAGLGLAILTKPSAYVYAAPFLFWYLISGFKKFRTRIWKSLFIMVFGALLISSGHYIRNIKLFGTPLVGAGAEANAIFNPRVLALGVIRRAGVHMGVPDDRINAASEKAIESIHGLLGVNPNDHRITFGGEEFRVFFSLLEDRAGNPAHLILIIVCVAVFFLRKHKNSRSDVAPYVLSAISGFIVLSLLLKWSPWQSRLDTPFFVLSSAFAGTVLSGGGAAVKLVMFALVLFSLPYVFCGQIKKIIGEKNIFTAARISQYFSDREYIRGAYISAADYIKKKGYRNIGLVMRGDDFEYPLWPLLQDKNKPVRIEHVYVKNVTSREYRLPVFNNFKPDCILFITGQWLINEKLVNSPALNTHKYACRMSIVRPPNETAPGESLPAPEWSVDVKE
ncbi:MAG: glycosyltransferase family 39 protein [Candidatus Omnitrophota bacterium]